jgi:hypothetical protein
MTHILRQKSLMYWTVRPELSPVEACRGYVKNQDATGYRRIETVKNEKLKCHDPSGGN